MQTSPETEKRICAMFDSFCKKVIRNYSRNLERAAANQRKYFSTGSISVQYMLNSLVIEDMPMPLKIWNIYRSRQIGAYYQSKGIKVIPTVSWAEPETFKFCFLGIPKGSVVSVSTIGVKRDEAAMKIWAEGMTEMIRQIAPSAILIYGGRLDFDYGDIKTVYFENQVTEKWKNT